MKRIREEQIESRRAKVLDLHSKGYTVRAISNSLKISKSTVQDDITSMRQEAADQISEYVQSLPYEWSKAITSIDRLLEEANQILDDKSLEVDQKITVIRTICDLTDKRLAMYSSPQMMQRAVQHVQSLKTKIEVLERERKKGAGFDIVTERHSVAGQPDKVVRKAVKKSPQKEQDIIV